MEYVRLSKGLAGVSLAISLMVTPRKNAGETPTLRKPASQRRKFSHNFKRTKKQEVRER
jgi:hypothetical protein